jgi:hypothetical protein
LEVYDGSDGNANSIVHSASQDAMLPHLLRYKRLYWVYSNELTNLVDGCRHQINTPIRIAVVAP